MLFKGLDRTVEREGVHVVWYINAELVRIRSAITAAVSKSGGMVREAMCHMCNGFRVDTPSDPPNISVRGPYD